MGGDRAILVCSLCLGIQEHGAFWHRGSAQRGQCVLGGRVPLSPACPRAPHVDKVPPLPSLASRAAVEDPGQPSLYLNPSSTFLYPQFLLNLLFPDGPFHPGSSFQKDDLVQRG